jgi:hypothetical protein
MHYGAALITGVFFRFYRFNKPDLPTSNMLKRDNLPSKHTLGFILTESIMDAMTSMTLIGGLIIFFSVITSAISLLPLSKNFYYISTGVLEITNGLSLVKSSAWTFKTQILAALGFISFGGLSIFAQTVSFINHTDIIPSVYLFAKLVHCVTAIAIGYLLFPFFF